MREVSVRLLAVVLTYAEVNLAKIIGAFPLELDGKVKGDIITYPTEPGKTYIHLEIPIRERTQK